MSRSFPDLPEVTSENFEQSLSGDQTFAEFFNSFLRLPVFGPALRYDWISAGFELLDHTAVDLSRRIRTALQQLRSKALPDPSRIPDNSYTVTRLDREQSLQWLKTHRLPFFLQSHCYYEFRLTKCLSQLSGPSRPQRPVTVGPSSSHVCDDDERCLRSGWGFCSGSEMMNSSFSSREMAGHRTASGWTAHSRSGGRICARRDFLDFKRSLVGGPGESILHLWMDIERLKTLSAKTRSRFLGWMKGQYVVSSSAAALSEQLLSRLGLNSTISWREERLRDIQPRLSEILLLYWGQRFCSLPSDQWEISERVWSSPVSSVCADAEPQPSCVCSCGDMKVELGGSEIQTLLEVLHTESRSGFVFTRFCQNSGQQLWENAVYFCSELLQYHQLFCQSKFDPYRVQRTAQLLYSSFLSSESQMSVGLSEERRRAVLLRLSPAFEDLFEPAEEHALNVLLEPWTLLSQALRDELHSVALWQEVRYAEPELFQTLQTLYTHTQSRQQQQQESRTPPAPAPAPDLWSKVPPEFRRFRLDSLLRNHLELQHFLSFMEENSASLDLQCWLDVEQLKNSDVALLEERITNIRDKYLSRNFLFGAGSPATEEQQMRLLQMCGGWQGLQHESVSLSVLSELQSLLHNRLETRWLPLFLSSSEFIARHQRKVTDVCEQKPVVRQRRRRHVWKQVSAGLMSCSQESVCLRRALLNPVSRLQLQKFLSVRDDLLENDLLFWLEVQRYKDLCHSRCDDAALQRKVCVFSELLKHWPEFVALRSAVGEDELLRALDQTDRRDRQRSRETDEQDDSSSQEEDEAHAGADEEQQNCGNDGMKAATYKISWSYWRHMAALEHGNTADVTSSSTGRSSSSQTQTRPRLRRDRTRPKSEHTHTHTPKQLTQI